MQCHKGKYNAYDNYNLFQKGRETYLRDIDLMSIISTVQQTRVLTNILLDKKQQKLAKFSKYRQIENYNSLGMNPMKEVVRHKSINFKKDNEYFIESINEITDYYKDKNITFADLMLINQAYPQLLNPNVSNLGQDIDIDDKFDSLEDRSTPIILKPEEQKGDSSSFSKSSQIPESIEIEKYNDSVSSIEFNGLKFATFDTFKNKTR